MPSFFQMLAVMRLHRSMAEQIHQTRRKGPLQITTKPVRQDGRESTSRLRDGLELDAVSASRRPTTRQMVVERSGVLNGSREVAGKPHHGGERRGQNQRRAAYETTGRSRQHLDQTEFEVTDGLDGEEVPLILRDDGPPNGTG